MNPVLAKKLAVLLEDAGVNERMGAVYHSIHQSDTVVNRSLCDFCAFCIDHNTAGKLCRYAGCSSAINAFRSGEPSIQRCWAGLVYFTVPVTENGACVGGVSVGGFCFEGDDVMGGIMEAISSFPERSSASFLSRAASVQRVEPARLRGLASYMMELTFSSGINSEPFFVRQHLKYIQQRQIADALQDIKAEVSNGFELIGDAQRMFSVIEQGDMAMVEQFFSCYLAKLLQASNWNLVKVKARLRMIVSMITTRRILAGGDPALAARAEARNLLRLDEAGSVEDSCYEVAEVIRAHLAGSDGQVPDKDSSLADRVVAWMELHFAEKINLGTIARAVGASESAIVKALRKDRGLGSRAVLREIRVAEARRLLASTRLGLSEIGGMCGFYDQSRFTKDFQAVTNLSPGRFRRMLDRSELIR